jgi:hypothetical protein
MLLVFPTSWFFLEAGGKPKKKSQEFSMKHNSLIEVWILMLGHV